MGTAGLGGAGYLAAACLALVFVGAAGGKLVAGAAGIDALRRLGVPAPRAVNRALPVVELGLATALLAAPRVGALGSLAALVAFSAFLLRAIRRGVVAPCLCFGRRRAAEAVSVVEVARNGLLAVLAVGALIWASTPMVPSVPEVVLVGSGVAAGVLVLALLDLRRRGGAVLPTRLARPPTTST